MENYNHFVAIVAGEHPYSLMEEYEDKDIEELHIKYYYKDAATMKAQHIQLAKAILNNVETEYEKLELEDIIETLENQSIDEFWEDLSDGSELDEDKNILSLENEQAKMSSFNIGKNLSLPFTLKDGTTVFQARKGDVDWEKMHLHDYDIYIRTWEIAMEGEPPLNDIEKNIKKNMGNMKEYFMFFGDKNTYASHCSAFWGYAFVSEDAGWQDLSYEKNQIEWVNGFYDTYIKPLDDNTLLTIFECRK
jgi:hypothetical protein